MQRRARIADGELDQVAPQPARRVLDRRREAGRGDRAAGVGAFGQVRVAELDSDAGERHAERLGGELGQHGIGAGAHVLRAATDDYLPSAPMRTAACDGHAVGRDSRPTPCPSRDDAGRRGSAGLRRPARPAEASAPTR